MFTGLVEEIGVVKSITRGTVGRLVVTSKKVICDAAIGDSISVSGVCLTVTSIGDGELSFDAVPETLSRSILADIRSGDVVNLEPSLRAGSKMGGHIVQGHVDGIGRIESINRIGESWVLRIGAPEDILKYIVEKGSVAIDGISLTVASVDDTSFTLAIIPHTYSSTTLHRKKPGDGVNLETDIIGKYIERFMSARSGSSGVTEDKLRNAGFM